MIISLITRYAMSAVIFVLRLLSFEFSITPRYYAAAADAAFSIILLMPVAAASLLCYYLRYYATASLAIFRR